MNTASSATPHDAIFKTFLSHPATAQDFLQLHLPASLRSICDLQTLKLESTSFIEEAARRLYGAALPLVDITVVPDDEIMQHRRVALLELVQKHIRKRDLMGLVEKLATLLITGHANDNQLKALFNYLLQAGDTDRFRDFIHGMAERLPEHKESLMTIAERLRQEGHCSGLQEGHINGLQEGLEKGLQQGKREEALRIATTMLTDGIDRHTILRITGLTADDLITRNH